MAIIGLGVDIVEIARIEKVIARLGLAFAKKILTERELEHYKNKKNPSPFLAKRFAIKEAAAKALGTGIAAGVSFQDFDTSNDKAGQPILTFSGKAADLAKIRGVTDILLSVSDEKHYAVATVLLQKS